MSDLSDFDITESAATQIAKLIKMEGNNKLRLRLAVNGGGCAGFSYAFSFDESQNSDDRLFQKNDVGVLVDETSLELLQGSVLDFVDDLIGAAFQVRNPNASSSCGCGTSFSL